MAVIPKPRPLRGTSPVRNRPAGLDLYEALSNIPKLPRALCAGDDPRNWDSTTGPIVERNQKICAQCCERIPCGEWASTQPKGALLGVVSGVLYGAPQPRKGVA